MNELISKLVSIIKQLRVIMKHNLIFTHIRLDWEASVSTAS